MIAGRSLALAIVAGNASNSRKQKVSGFDRRFVGENSAPRSMPAYRECAGQFRQLVGREPGDGRERPQASHVSGHTNLILAGLPLFAQNARRHFVLQRN
jgi:hypothetical protein